MDVTELHDDENPLLRQTIGMGCKQRSIKYLALEYFIAGLVLMITIIGIPFDLQSLKLGRLAIWPFESQMKWKIFLFYFLFSAFLFNFAPKVKCEGDFFLIIMAKSV